MTRLWPIQVNDEASDKVLEVEQEYNKHRRPIYDKRRQIISQLPNFWQTALVQHQVLRETCTDDDINVLGFCTEVRAVSEQRCLFDDVWGLERRS